MIAHDRDGIARIMEGADNLQHLAVLRARVDEIPQKCRTMAQGRTPACFAGDGGLAIAKGKQCLFQP